MTDVNEQLKKLAFKTPRKYVGKDPSGNDYVTARYVMNVLDSAVGPANWSDTYRVVALIERPDGTARMSVECSLTVLGVTKVDVGYGEILLSNSNKPYGQFEKEAYSIAFKRAAVKFGIARDLYKDGMPTYEREAEAPADELDEAQPEPEPEQKPAPPKASKPKPKQPAAAPPPPWNEDKPAPERKLARPYDAETFRKGYLMRVGKSDVKFASPSDKQAQYLASLMTSAFKESSTPDADRLAVLGWLTGRDIASTKDLTGAEAKELLDILAADGGDIDKDAYQEMQNCLAAAYKANGQGELFPDAA